MYRVHLTPEHRQELQQRAHASGVMPRTRDRLEMIRLADAGWSAPRIAAHLQLHEATVRFWIKRYLQAGFDGLPDQSHVGRRSALTSEILAAVRQQLRQGEQTWTASQLTAWVAEQYGVRRSPAHLCRLLKRAGCSYKRTNHSLRHKQNPAEFVERRADLETLEKGGSGSA